MYVYANCFPLIPTLSQISPAHTAHTSKIHVLILSTHLRLGLPSGLFPSGFPTNFLYPFLFSPTQSDFKAV
jgi:hypothetical protein